MNTRSFHRTGSHCLRVSGKTRGEGTVRGKLVEANRHASTGNPNAVPHMYAEHTCTESRFCFLAFVVKYCGAIGIEMIPERLSVCWCYPWMDQEHMWCHGRA